MISLHVEWEKSEYKAPIVFLISYRHHVSFLSRDVQVRSGLLAEHDMAVTHGGWAQPCSHPHSKREECSVSAPGTMYKEGKATWKGRGNQQPRLYHISDSDSPYSHHLKSYTLLRKGCI